MYKTIRELIRKTADNEAIGFEFGSFDGTFTKQICAMFPQLPKRFFVFEPHPTQFEICKSNLVGFSPVELHKKAVGNRVGKIMFHASTITENGKTRVAPCSSIREPYVNVQLRPHIEFISSYEVDVITLDSFCKDAGVAKIDFICHCS